MKETRATFTPIQEIGEFGLIDRIREIVGTPLDETVRKSIGDDAAVYRVDGNRVHIATTDALIENVHFDRSFVPLRHLGFKSMSVNVSDIAAMNALPRYALVVLGLPNNVSVEMVEALYDGMKAACDQYGFVILGGDTTAASRLTISITVIGESEEDKVAYRSGAREGDFICVTGDLGGAYAGLKVLLDEKRAFEQHGDRFKPQLEPFEYVIQRQLRPIARMDVVKAWREQAFVPNALIDISDGLASEVHHICTQSACGAVVKSGAVPIDLNTRQTADRFGEDVDTYALFGGEDYELLFTAAEAQLERIHPDSFRVLGKITAASEGVRVEMPSGESMSLQATGYRHFSE